MEGLQDLTVSDAGAARLVLRRENKALLAAGLALWMLAWVGLAVALASFSGERVTLAVWLAVLVWPALIGLALLIVGLNARQVVADPQTMLGEHEQAQAAWLSAQAEGDVGWMDEEAQRDQYWEAQKVAAERSTHKLRRRWRIWGLVLMAVSLELLLMTALILWSSGSDVLVLFLPLTALPAMVGGVLLCRAWAVLRREVRNLDALRAYAAEVRAGGARGQGDGG
jgi:hypothetical protein